jgi:hypothetical protein
MLVGGPITMLPPAPPGSAPSSHPVSASRAVAAHPIHRLPFEESGIKVLICIEKTFLTTVSCIVDGGE